MKGLKIKVCGMTNAQNMLEVAALKPDYLGFIFYPPSPRDITEKIGALPLEKLPGTIQKVAVLVNKPIDEALDIIEMYQLDMVQLHGQENPEYCTKMQKKVPVVKAFSVADRLPADLSDYESSCDYFLFDTKADKPGGTGISFNHTILEDYQSDVPFFLSGGINELFFKAEIPFHHPLLYALDINSRFETFPGIKDVMKVKDFLLEMKSMHQ